ncbi:MAG: SpoIIE family protein phosphatase, partial [Oscillospiraceae bacterium]|nr:SpoIIE family protein phosphatase [Oscillospiraceae bacterium]
FAVSSEAVPAILYEAFAASVVFMLLPASFISRLSAFLPERGAPGGAARAREYTRRRVAETSRAFKDLRDAARSASESGRETDDPALIFSRAADTVCRRCEKSARCWQEEYNDTRDVMNNLTPAILRRGSLEKGDYPAFFASACVKLDSLTYAVNCELRSYIYRRQMKNRLRSRQKAALGQYSGVSDILVGISSELGGGVVIEAELEARARKYLKSLGIAADVAVFRGRGGRLRAEICGAEINAFRRDRAMLDKLSAALGVRLCLPERKTGRPEGVRLELLEAEPLSAVVGAAKLSRRGGEVCGDSGAYFKTDEGVLHILLSDGMGSGEAAAKLSADCVRILERFLRSGVAPGTALRMLNGIMLLRGEDETVCATVDLMCVNLFSGDMTLFKYGAAPTYIKSGSSVERVTRGHSLAAGLGAPPDDAPDCAEASLSHGMFAVAVSDGAASVSGESELAPDESENALMRLIAEYEGDDPRELALAIVEAAEARGADDDITAIAVKISRRE